MVVDDNRNCAGCLFDMDNTLYNFVSAKLSACTEAVEVIGRGDGDGLFRYFLRGIHGFEHADNIRDYMQDQGTWDPDTFNTAFKVYEKVKLECIEPFPGVRQTLELLAESGVKMAIVTDAGSFHAIQRLEKIGVAHHFECVITPDKSGKRKPEPEPFLLALDTMELRPEETWVVGDSLRREIAPGNLLGMTTVYAKYGDWLGIPAPSIQPDYILHSFDELPGMMNLIRNKNKV